MPRDRTLQKETGSGKKTNARRPAGERLGNRRGVQTLFVEPAPMLMPLTRVYACIGWLFLLPACLIAGMAFIRVLSRTADEQFLFSPQVWFFMMGFLMWMLLFFALPVKPVRSYVFGHEMTHALATMLCGGKVEAFHVAETGGYIISDRNNFFIALAPYFVPFYTMAGGVVFLVAGAFTDLTAWVPLPYLQGFRPFWILFGFTGFSWGLHLTFTVWMLFKGQSDLQFSGVSFSLLLIFLVNVLLITAMLLLASPQVGSSDWLQQIQEVVRALRP